MIQVLVYMPYRRLMNARQGEFEVTSAYPDKLLYRKRPLSVEEFNALPPTVFESGRFSLPVQIEIIEPSDKELADERLKKAKDRIKRLEDVLAERREMSEEEASSSAKPEEAEDTEDPVAAEVKAKTAEVEAKLAEKGQSLPAKKTAKKAAKKAAQKASAPPSDFPREDA